MGRKARYSKELKLETVKRYLKGESNISLCNEYRIPYRKGKTIISWANKYVALGESAFDESHINKSYSKELKERVIKEYLDGKDSLEGIANRYNISSVSIVINWVKKYNEGIEIKDYNPKGDVYTMKSRKTAFEERIEIVRYVLTNNLDYKGAADKYTVPYASIFQWVKKYNEFGEDGLKDGRGRPSSNVNKELSIEEKQAIEIERLKKELERQKMINEVLKKNVEIRKRMEKDSHLLDKKINTKR
jgi:transposase-like protein